MRDELTGEWLFGYVDALQCAGIDTDIVCVSALVDEPVRWQHAATQAPIWLLPASRAYRRLRRRLSDPYAWSAREALGDVSRTSLPMGILARHAAPYCATPLVTLARRIRRENYQAVLCQEYESPRFDVCVGLGTILRRPVFATFQGGNYHLTRLEDLTRPIALHACRGVIVGSAAEAQRVQDRYRLNSRKIARIFNPLDVTSWSRREGPTARAELGIDQDALLVVWHGRVDLHRKGLDVLVDAWWRLGEAFRDKELRLLLVGTGSDAEELRRRITKAALGGVHLVDEYVLDRRRLQRYLSAADVYVFPSRNEGFPLAVIEALASSLPVVAADAPGVRDIIENGEESGGLIVPQGDGAALASGLERILRDDALREELARRARRRAETAFTPESVGRQLHDFLIARGAQVA
jgi:glycosyltransferase involved in cell wall biosynthesis